MAQDDPQAALRDEALARIEAVLGAAHVHRDGPGYAARARSSIPEQRPPAAVVLPGSRDEVVEVVRIAAALGVPLQPVSKGLNHGYGTAHGAHPGAIVVGLERMDRIVSVDQDLAYAVLEPGVSYRKLHEHLEALGGRLWTDCTDGPPEGSVLGNALERGIGETPYGDHFGNLCGLEVVLADGTVLETGGGPPGRLRTHHVHKWGTGPFLDGLFSQAAFGIVTRAGMWLMPRPEAFRSFTFGLHRSEDFAELVERLRGLTLAGIVNTKIHLINDVVTTALVGPLPEGALEPGKTHLTGSARARLRERLGIPEWSFGAAVYGTRAMVAAKEAEIRARLSGLGRLVFFDEARIGRIERLVAWIRAHRASLPARGLEWVIRRATGKALEVVELAPHIHRMFRGVPGERFVRHAFFRHGAPYPTRDVDPSRDGVGLTWFAPLAPMTGKDLTELTGICSRTFEEHGFDPYLALLLANPRAMVVLTQILYRKDDPAQVERARACYRAVTERTLAAGFQQYRSGIQADGILDCAPAFKAFAERLKRTADPGLILAPGRYGLGARARP